MQYDGTRPGGSQASGSSGGNGNGRGITIVVAILGIAAVLASAFVGGIILYRVVSGPEAASSPEPTLRPTFTSVAAMASTPTTDTIQLPSVEVGTATMETPQPQVTSDQTAPPPPSDTPTSETPKETVTPPDTPEPTRPPAAPATMASPDYGIQAFLWWRPEVAHRDLGLVTDAGFTWVKQWFAWRDIEGKGKGQYDWSTADRIVNQAEEFGVNLLLRLDHEPDWAGPPPGNLNHFVDFVTALVTRYKGRVDAYQIWNEPNLAREWGNKPPNAGEYTQMLKAAYQAIKAVDPNAIVISAGMAPTTELSQRAVPDTQFIQNMYNAGAKPYFDMLGAHGAGYKAPPEMDPAQIATDPNYYNVGDPNCPGDPCRIYGFRHVEDLRQIMVNNGDGGKRVAVLEFGWTRDERPESPYYWHRVDDQFMQGDYMVRAYQYAKDHWQPWIGVMSLIYLPDAQWSQDDEQYWWSVMEPSQIDELKLKAPYVMLCIYIRQERGLGRCPYEPE
jgi:hypothetical protein